MSLETAIQHVGDGLLAIAGRDTLSQSQPFVFRIGPVSEQTGPVQPTPQFQSNCEGELMSMSELTATQNVRLTVEFKDKKLNKAKVHGAPQWFTDNTDLIALVPDADGMGCTVSAVGALGSASVTLRGDADLGEPVKEIIGTHQVDIVAGEATVVDIVAEPPVEQ